MVDQQDVGAMEIDENRSIGFTVLAMGNNSDGQLGCGVFWSSEGFLRKVSQNDVCFFFEICWLFYVIEVDRC